MRSPIASFFILLLWVSLLPLAAGSKLAEKEHLSSSDEAVRDILKAAPRRQSSFIFILDGATSAEVSRQVHGDLDVFWGATVFEVQPDPENFNRTQDQLSDVLKEARRLRLESWSVTVVVMTNDDDFLTTFAQVSDQERLVVWSTRVLVVTSIALAKLHPYMQQYWVLSMMNCLILQLSNGSDDQRGETGELLIYLPYRPKGKTNVVKVGRWTPRSGLTLSSLYQMFPEKYSNFYGSPMNVTCWPFMPYFMSLEEVFGDKSLSNSYTGRDYIMLETLGDILNFTINNLPVASWDEMMLKVIKKESFMSPMKMSILPHLLDVMDFSIAYEPETLTFTMSKPELKPQWQNLYYPLSNSVWGSTFACFLLMPLLLFLIDRLKCDRDWKRWSSPWKVSQETLATFFGQPLSPGIPVADSFRVLLATWLLFSYIIGTAYRANLTAFLTLPKYPPRIETLKEFINAESTLLIPPDTVDFYNGFKQSPTGDLRTLSERMFFVPDIGVGFPRVAKENAGYMYERRNMELNIARYYTNKETGWTPFYVAKDNIWPGSSAWPIVRDAPFKPILDRFIRRFVEAGLLMKWDQDIVDLFKRATRESRRKTELNAQTEGSSSVSDSDNAGIIEDAFDIGDGGDQGGKIKPLSIVHLQGPLLLLLFSLLVSVVVFAVEVIMG